MTTNTASTTFPQHTDTPGEQPVKRKRGRPRKNPEATGTTTASEGESALFSPDAAERVTRSGSQGFTAPNAPAMPSTLRATPGSAAAVYEVIKVVYKAVIDLDENGERQIAELFLEMPDKKEYADYYEVIQNPIALDVIEKKIRKKAYANIAQFQADFVTMIENAKTYNRKGSAVFKDAERIMAEYESVLAANMEQYNVTLETPANSKRGKTADWSPPTDNWTKDDFLFVWKKIYSHKKDGERVAELFEELPDAIDYPDYYEEIQNPIALDGIKQKIDSESYKSLDDFVADFYLMFDNARTYNAEGSSVYADAEELNFKFNQLIGRDADSEDVDREDLETITWKGEKYSVGDFCYIDNIRDPSKPIIGHIHNIWRDRSSKKQGVSVYWFLRPEQTVHPATRKFMESEVFKTNRLEHYVLEDILGKCFVLFKSDYVRGRPRDSIAGRGPSAKKMDVYVCESRYVEIGKQIQKIKSWNSCLPESCRDQPVDLELFAEPLVPKMVPSIFAEEGDSGSNDRREGGSKPYALQSVFNEKKSSVPAPIQPPSANPSSGPSTAAPKSATEEVPVKRGRGRPRKSEVLARNAAAGIDISNSGSSVQAPISLRTRSTSIVAAPIKATSIPAPIITASATSSQALLKSSGTGREYSRLPSANGVGIGINVANAPVSTKKKPASPPKAIALAGMEELADEIVQNFANREGRLLWFTTPSIDVVDSNPPPIPSLDYLVQRARELEAGETVPKPISASSPKRARSPSPDRSSTVTDKKAKLDNTDVVLSSLLQVTEAFMSSAVEMKKAMMSK